MYKITVDGRELSARRGQTILQVCRENGIEIPTLCFDERVEIYGGCGLCVVEIEGNNKLLKACATEISDNMAVLTNTARVRESRRTNLELLLSNHIGDCRAPCHLNCPADTDCQGYVGLIANGEYDAAIRLIKEKIPLPAAIGRVCPHPCEENCRRALVEEPVSIMSLKRFAADTDLAAETSYLPPVAPSTGKRVAVIGGGPFGLSAAYFLRRRGHEVTIYDAMPSLGGMLRYGIPEYRLPKKLLDKEIALIEKLGVKFTLNTKVGTDIALDAIRTEYDAVCVGIGAWVSTGTRAKGENLPGVLGGIDFLRSVVRGEAPDIGENVAIIGGGNTAMDAARTAIRLGAKHVYNVYRRTINEMPADALEIEEAREEGVIFKTLTNPLEYTAGENGRVNSAVLQIMELGEPDASGRRSPVPVKDKTETIAVDTVILATGQSVNPEGLAGLQLTRRGGIIYDDTTYMTSMRGVFAGGDCGNDKISIAIEAIGDADKCAASVDAYLRGEILPFNPTYIHTRDDITEKTFEDRERLTRQSEATLAPDARRDNFNELRPQPFSAEQAAKEASRCLECGCGDYFDCKLVAYAREYSVQPWRFDGEKHRVEFEDLNDYIVRDPNKCVLCGLCVRVCSDVVGAGALGFTERGFDATVSPALGRPLAETSCVSCGNCVAMCPTGALQERAAKKPVPLKTEKTLTVCSRCSVGCEVCLETHGDMLVRATPADGALLCKLGRFEYDKLPATAAVAIDYAAVTKSLAERLRGGNAVIALSPRLTNEEAAAVKALAERSGAKLVVSAPEVSDTIESELVRRLAERADVRPAQPAANLRGLTELGIDKTATADGASALIIFGDAPAALPAGVDFIAHCAPAPISNADVALPCVSYSDGHYTGADGKLLQTRALPLSDNSAPNYAAIVGAIASAL
ncbi:MAG: FAD-dependent oxidoreductase [Oscillospiraceae bacterium]|jgi:formate dehydrogenase major subunit|nr:FAD-dependent oxidoreductase [Oscillospiraceae bacterium]